MVGGGPAERAAVRASEPAALAAAAVFSLVGGTGAAERAAAGESTPTVLAPAPAFGVVVGAGSVDGAAAGESPPASRPVSSSPRSVRNVRRETLSSGKPATADVHAGGPTPPSPRRRAAASRPDAGLVRRHVTAARSATADTSSGTHSRSATAPYRPHSPHAPSAHAAVTVGPTVGACRHRGGTQRGVATQPLPTAARLPVSAPRRAAGGVRCSPPPWRRRRRPRRQRPGTGRRARPVQRPSIATGRAPWRPAARGPGGRPPATGGRGAGTAVTERGTLTRGGGGGAPAAGAPRPTRRRRARGVAPLAGADAAERLRGRGGAARPTGGSAGNSVCGAVVDVARTTGRLRGHVGRHPSRRSRGSRVRSVVGRWISWGLRPSLHCHGLLQPMTGAVACHARAVAHPDAAGPPPLRPPSCLIASYHSHGAYRPGTRKGWARRSVRAGDHPRWCLANWMHSIRGCSYGTQWGSERSAWPRLHAESEKKVESILWKK